MNEVCPAKQNDAAESQENQWICSIYLVATAFCESENWTRNGGFDEGKGEGAMGSRGLE